MIAIAALCGVLIAGGAVLAVAAFNGAISSFPRLSTRLWIGGVNNLGRRNLVIALTAACAGAIAAAISGWWLLIVILPAVALVLPMLLAAPPHRELELLQAIDRWLRALGSLLTTGRSISDAIRVSARQPPALLGPCLRTLTARLDDRWTVEHALFAMADELDSVDADAVLAALALAAQRGGTGATAALAALADNLQDRLRALRDIGTERAKPRFVVRQVTVITAVVLGLALAFGGTFFAPFGSPVGQVILGLLVTAYLGSLLALRHMTLPRPRQRILRSVAS